jgi:hypothetical protein
MMAEKTMMRNGFWKHSRRVAWRKVADEAIILDVETAAYFSLSGAGLRMWELIGQGKTALEISRIIFGEYDASEEDIREDCVELIGKLRKERLIENA